MKLTDYKIAVLGGGGFLGSHIVDRLRQLDLKPIIASRKNGYDFREQQNAEKFFKENNPGIVINCVAHQGGIRYQQLYSGKILYDNLIIHTNLIEAARKCNSLVKFVNIIAGCSYPGYIEDGLLKETELFNGPMHETVENYGITHRVKFLLSKYYYKQYGFNAINLILINLYGPREHFHPDRSHGLAALLLKFYQAKKFNKPKVPIWGSGKPIREWLYVEDAVTGILKATDIYNDISPLNIAVGRGYTITQLSEIIKKVVEYEGELEYDTSKPDGTLKKVADISKMKTILHWEPEITIEVGLRRLFKWLDENYDKIVDWE